jgi:coenzyme PQQ biosynthesis protein PqqD
MTVDDRPMRGASAVSREVQGALVVLDVHSGRYFALDEVGARIWSLCDGSREVVEVASALATEYDAPAAVIERDVVELVEELRKQSLIVSAGTMGTRSARG